MRKSVSLQKVAKLVVDGWFGDRPDWKKCRSHHEHQHAQSDPTQSLVTGKSGKPAQTFLPQIAPRGRHGFCESAENSYQYCAINKLAEVHVTKTPYLSSAPLKHERHSRAWQQPTFRLQDILTFSRARCNAGCPWLSNTLPSVLSVFLGCGENESVSVDPRLRMSLSLQLRPRGAKNLTNE